MALLMKILWENHTGKANHYCSSNNTGANYHLGRVGNPNRISLDRKTFFFPEDAMLEFETKQCYTLERRLERRFERGNIKNSSAFDSTHARYPSL